MILIPRKFCAGFNCWKSGFKVMVSCLTLIRCTVILRSMKSSVRNRALDHLLDRRQAFTGDILRDFVIAVEFAKRDVVAFAFEFAGDAAAAAVDGKDVIV